MMLDEKQKLKKFFIEVNTSTGIRSDFINYPLETLAKYGISFQGDDIGPELKLLVKKFQNHPPKGSLDTIQPASDMYQMINLMAFDATPSGEDDLLIT